MNSMPNALWSDGWYRFAHRLPSAHFGPRPSGVGVDLGIIHSISLPPDTYGGNDIELFFTGQLDATKHPYFKQIADLRVSAHFLIKRDGRLMQFVSVNDRAWHAGQSQHRGRDNCNDFSVGIELEGNDSSAFESAQYDTLQALAQALNQHYPIQEWVGHSDVAPGRKTDPGLGFNWQALRRSLGHDVH